MNKSGDFYFSQKQLERYIELNRSGCCDIYISEASGRPNPVTVKRRRNFAKLDSGEIVEYTEWVDFGRKPLGNFDDQVFLGSGIYSHSGEEL